MATRSEVDRLKAVYREYADRGLGQSRWSRANRGNQAILRERQLKIHEFLRRGGFFPLDKRRILDVGCGSGEQLAALKALGAKPENLFGIDLIAERIRAAQRNLPEISFQLGNAEALPFADGFFDLVAVFTVFTSILDERMAGTVGREISRVLRTGGSVLWYDFRMNNPLNEHVRGLSRKKIQHLFPGFRLTLETVSLLPPLARRLGPLTDLLYPCLRALPFLRSHYLGVLTKS